MKRFMISSFMYLLSCLVVYLCTAFIKFDLDVSEFTENQRIGIILIGAILGMFPIIIFNIKEDDKNDTKL